MAARFGVRRATTLAVAAITALGLGAVAAPAAHAEPTGSWTLDAPYWGWEVRPDEGVWYSSPLGTHLVPSWNGMSDLHGSLGGGRGTLGYPRGAATDQVIVDGAYGEYQAMERGVLYASDWGTFFTASSSGIARHYARTGGGGGTFGYPISNEVREAPGWWYQEFGYATIYASRYGVFDVTLALDLEHLAQGGGSGLGYPTAPRRSDGSDHFYQTFERGIVYCFDNDWDEDVCSTVRGGFLDVHRRNGGGSGWLGYPVGNEGYELSTDSWFQAFEYGYVEIGRGYVEYYSYDS